MGDGVDTTEYESVWSGRDSLALPAGGARGAADIGYVSKVLGTAPGGVVLASAAGVPAVPGRAEVAQESAAE